MTGRVRGWAAALALTVGGVSASCAGMRGPPDAVEAGDASRRTLCVVRGDRVESVAITIGASGDTLVAGRPLRDAHPADPPTYIESLPWFRTREAILFRRHRYTQERPPLLLDPREIRWIGTLDGTPVFVMAFEPEGDVPDGFMLPVRPGCVFQPYLSS